MRILYDASRLMSRADRSSPTGVDRVCLAYAEWLLARPDVLVLPVRGRKNRLVEVDKAWFRRCVVDLRERWNGNGANGDHGHEARLLAALTGPTRPVASVISPPPTPAPDRPADRMRVFRQFFRSRHTTPLPPADLYLTVGHTTLQEPSALRDLAAAGVERVVMIHDLIPVTHPEFCRPGDGDKHHARVANTLRHASRVIVNSAYTGDELRAFAVRENLPRPPIHVAHLGLEPAFTAGEAVQAARPYFVHVGTIEARKNLALLLTMWRRLEERMGDRTPSLVLVGRYGWENEAVLDHLERSPNLRGVVHQASNLSDTTLAALMRGARAVLAPSSVEGFDLPAVEACAMGLLLIASDIAPHRELTPGAELIDPLDGLGWLAAVERAALSPPPPPADYRAPSWEAHFDTVAQAIGLAPVSPLASGDKGL
ncbi:glycosyltransferase family 1 protein [Brevundimonas sp. SORGH_AS_0993]|uniref:glycosyltransferase family 4 protein n=1 Tax=Brevundimonas sp. SORGH_AS_0993 TaxID=3041794 RepID=UPI002787E9C7|nr:glycosyltransferase family 1 protein [Brevundimonas sp. SORGH_AS_0993]MDQ1154650.1 glycosyltransferase involved in cell wall biosynthesis [Brevundimonas sp. SORGH_AS_0993]